MASRGSTWERASGVPRSGPYTLLCPRRRRWFVPSFRSRRTRHLGWTWHRTRPARARAVRRVPPDRRVRGAEIKSTGIHGQAPCWRWKGLPSSTRFCGLPDCFVFSKISHMVGCSETSVPLLVFGPVVESRLGGGPRIAACATRRQRPPPHVAALDNSAKALRPRKLCPLGSSPATRIPSTFGRSRLPTRGSAPRPAPIAHQCWRSQATEFFPPRARLASWRPVTQRRRNL